MKPISNDEDPMSQLSSHFWNSDLAKIFFARYITYSKQTPG